MELYVSALSNEADLHDPDTAWTVFGINDRTLSIANCTIDCITYRNVYETSVGGKMAEVRDPVTRGGYVLRYVLVTTPIRDV